MVGKTVTDENSCFSLAKNAAKDVFSGDKGEEGKDNKATSISFF